MVRWLLQGKSPSAQPVIITPAALSILPNPANETATVMLNKALDENCTLSLFNYLGSKIVSYSINAGQTQLIIEVSNLAEGIYILQVEEQKNLSSKLVVIK